MAALRSTIGAVAACMVVAACGTDDDSTAGGDATTTSTTAATTTTTTSTTTTTAAPAPESARYRVTIVAEWSPSTHPSTLPPGWHTSPAVLAAHGMAGDVVAIGSTASPGIESMAETGQTSLMVDELAANPAVGGVETGRRVDGAGSDELEVVATQSTPLVSLVTMLAPSPDWFVGVADAALFDDGAWIERTEIDLTPWDAGTDSGAQFTSGNSDTQPAQAIAAPRDPDFVAAASEGRFGYAVIERIG